MRRVCAVLLLLAGIPSARAEGIPAEVRACDDAEEYPPFSYFLRQDGRKTDQVAGYAVDYLQQILEESGRRGTVRLLPWRRCLERVRNGELDLVLSAAPTPERSGDFVFTPPYFSLTQRFYFPLSRPAPSVAALADLDRLKLCGQFGYAYPDYGSLESRIDRGAKSLEAVAAMLQSGRCDVFLTNLEIVAGRKLITGRDPFPASGFGSARPPEIADVGMRMMIGRSLPYREALLSLLSEGIDRMRRTGAESRLADRYLAPLR
jgi:polar amino acid transport system substrate-binding protein